MTKVPLCSTKTNKRHHNEAKSFSRDPLKMAAAAIGSKTRMRELLGGYGVSASVEVGVSTEALITKVKSVSTFTEVERSAVLRALEWCARGT